MSNQRPRILAIDDTPTNLLTLGAALETDFDLQIATSGAMGLAMALKSPPDLILLDVMMPEMDGYAICERIMASPELRAIPVVFVTALAETDAESAGLALGAADYITKPINVEIARQRIRNLLERERLRKEVEEHRDRLEELVRSRALALSIAKEATEVANRATGSFLANMSHELRTPLNGVMGMTELALRRATDPKLKDYLAKAMQSSQRLLAVVNDALEISRIEADRLALDAVDFELATVLKKLKGLTAPSAAEKGLALVFELAPGLAAQRLRGDALRLGQILLHLTGNAIKFTDQGSVAVCATTVKESAVDVLLRFEVRDTGIGISPEDQKRLFAPFEQADGSLSRQYGGAGLGLALCKRLALAMGGALGVESRLGAGSLFWVTVRLARCIGALDGSPASASASAEEALKARFSGAPILVAQDDPVSREVAKDFLEMAGLRVDLAGDGAAAVEMARHRDYALILMDIQMPRMSGIDAALKIHALPGREGTAIVAMTASVCAVDKARCYAVGMKDFLAQPIEPQTLLATVLRWLSQRQA